jgi:hypothetical protein
MLLDRGEQRGSRLRNLQRAILKFSHELHALLGRHLCKGCGRLPGGLPPDPGPSRQVSPGPASVGPPGMRRCGHVAGAPLFLPSMMGGPASARNVAGKAVCPHCQGKAGGKIWSVYSILKFRVLTESEESYNTEYSSTVGHKNFSFCEQTRHEGLTRLAIGRLKGAVRVRSRRSATETNPAVETALGAPWHGQGSTSSMPGPMAMRLPTIVDHLWEKRWP